MNLDEHVRYERSKVTPALRAAIFDRDGGLCQLCLEPIGHEDWDVDHSIPLCQWGTTTDRNVQLAHSRCNGKKWAKTVMPGGLITLFTLAYHKGNPPTPTLLQPPPTRREPCRLLAPTLRSGRERVSFYSQGILPNLGLDIGVQIGFMGG